MSDWRGRFALGADVYLLSHSVGRPPRDLESTLAEGYFAAWARSEGEPWEAWLGIVQGFRERLGALLNAHPDQICPQTNLSGALSRVIGALPRIPARDVLLLSEDDFPTMGFVLQQAERLGYRRRFVPAGLDPLDAAAWRRQFEPDVRLALLTHVQSNTGRRIPVAEITHAACERGVLTVVDIAQSAGVVPIDVAEWNADFVLGSCVKWLCGGPGAGFLWASTDMLRGCEPVDVGWFSHANPFEFDIRSFRYADDARRFWGGTPSVLPFAAAAHSIALLGEIGVEAISGHNRALAQRLMDAVPTGCPISPPSPEHRGGTVILGLGERQGVAIARFEARGIRFDARAGGLRLSPHIYNTEQDIDAVIEVLRETYG